ncbi:MAG: MFS transporter [Bacteroidota bacterium]|nr:MFS transporter [Bacteroidota bacterium]MDQ6903694.1 MFS transporter [Bacteroidota bacterium]
MKKTFPYRYRVLIMLFFLTLITYLDRISISLVGVRIKSAFNLSNEQFGWVLGAFALAYALFEIPSGILGDRIGQRKVFIRIVLLWSLFTALTGATTGFISLLCIRFLFGAGESGAYPNSSGTISRWFPVTETTKGISWLSIGANAGSALAPLIVIPIAVVYGWRAPFFVNGFIGLIWVLICFLWFRNHPSEMKKITKEEKDFIEKNRRFINHKQPFPWKIAFKNRSLWALVLAWYCCTWANYFFIAWMPVYLQEGRHFSENEMKIITSSLFIAGIIGALLAGFFGDWLVKRKSVRFSRRFIAMISSFIIGGLLLLTAVTTNNTIVVASLIIAHLFYLPIVVTSFSTCVDIGGNNAGTVAGIMNGFGQLGAFFMAIVFGKIVDATHSFIIPLFIVSGVLFFGGLCWLFIDAGKPLIKEDTDSFHMITAVEKNLVIN